jgi:hypothetical protein
MYLSADQHEFDAHLAHYKKREQQLMDECDRKDGIIRDLENKAEATAEKYKLTISNLATLVVRLSRAVPKPNKLVEQSLDYLHRENLDKRSILRADAKDEV